MGEVNKTHDQFNKVSGYRFSVIPECRAEVGDSRTTVYADRGAEWCVTLTVV